jgi:predicted phosphate transport protein (TIGR00153 family)
MLFANRQNSTYFDVLEAQARHANEAAVVFSRFAGDFREIGTHVKTLEQIEHDADQLTHKFVNTVNTQFITPLDKEDLHSLTDQLDDITDAIEAAGARVALYRLPSPRPDLARIVEMLVSITARVESMIAQLRSGFRTAELSEVIADIHSIESKSDKAFRKAVLTLFDDESIDARLLIKWKEVYERMEKAINRCEKLAGFVESLMAKYA